MASRLIRITDIASFATKDKKNDFGEVIKPGKKNVGLLPVSPATIWRWVATGQFPKPFKLGDQVTVWRAED